METKYCKKCNLYKPISEFYKNNRGGCKKCIRKYQAEYYLKHYAPPRFNLDRNFRKCSNCKEVKPIGEFYKDSSNKSGYYHYCKICSDDMKRKRLGLNKSNKILSPKGYKKCIKCKIQKRKSEFENSVRCKECIEKRRLELEEKKLTREDRRKEYERKWKSRPEYKAKQKIYRVGYNKRIEVRLRNRKKNEEYRSKEENKEKARQRTIEWVKDNPEASKLQSQIKRARKKNAKGSFTSEQWLKLTSFFDNCPRCLKKEPLSIDHIIPLSKEGTNYIDNIQPLCLSCNTKKNAYLIVDYRPEEVRLWAHKQMESLYD